MTRLEAAYPPGSVVICRQDLPGDGMARLPTRLEVRGTVLSRKADLATGQGIATWTTRGSDTPALTLTFAGTQRKCGSGYYSRIDPDSMVVSMPVAGPEGEKTVLEGMRQRLPAGEEFAPFSQTEITDFHSYVVRKPDDPPSYCHKKSRNDHVITLPLSAGICHTVAGCHRLSSRAGAAPDGRAA